MLFDLNYALEKCTYRVALNTMRAIVKTESSGNPLAIGINGHARLKYQAHNLKEATAWVDYLEKHGYNIDIGLAQVNIKNAHKYGFKAHDMLEPCHNLLLASWILHENYVGALSVGANQRSALFQAISAYNTGNYQSGFSNGYVNRVVSNARKK